MASRKRQGVAKGPNETSADPAATTDPKTLQGDPQFGLPLGTKCIGDCPLQGQAGPWGGAKDQHSLTTFPRNRGTKWNRVTK